MILDKKMLMRWSIYWTNSIRHLKDRLVIIWGWNVKTLLFLKNSNFLNWNGFEIKIDIAIWKSRFLAF